MSPNIVWIALSFEGGLFVLALLLGWLLDRDPLESLCWDWSALACGVAATLPLLLGYRVLARWPIGPLQRIKELLEEFVATVFAKATPLDLAVVAIAAGLGEEVLFRGLVQAALGDWLGPIPGLVLASVLFGLAHAVTVTYVFLAGLVGVYLGAVWQLSENLLSVVVTHALYDFVVLLLVARRVRVGKPHG